MSKHVFSRPITYWKCLAITFGAVYQLAGQSPEALSSFFEGRQVIVRLDMPGTQQGVDVYPQRSQALDLSSYSNRIKTFGTALRNGDSVMVTKIKVKDNNLEFQLAGGGYGTFLDDTDTSVHFLPTEKSRRERWLEDQLSWESDWQRRRALRRELDDLRSWREQHDQRNFAEAENLAEAKKQRVDAHRLQGGSRFNIHFEPRRPVSEITPQVIMAALAPYVSFPPETFGAFDSRGVEPSSTYSPTPSSSPDPISSLRKGLALKQVEDLLGPPVETHDRSQNGLNVTTCTFQNRAVQVQGDFVNGVLVQYTLSSR